jgi:hypothetical protein
VPVDGGEPELLMENAAQAATSASPTYAFLRPLGTGFGGTSLDIAGPDGVRTLVAAKAEMSHPKMSPDGSKVAYHDGGSIYVVDVATGKSSEVAQGRMAAWLDEDTLIVAPER